MKIRCLALTTLILTTPRFGIANAGPGEGGGGDTYRTAFDEARQIAVVALNRLPELQSANQKLRQVYQKHREAWIRAAQNFSIDRSDIELYDRDGDGRSKAALADPESQKVTISIPYLEKNPVSVIQLVITAIHESGHLAKVPLTHLELDNVGMAIAREKLVDYLGTNELKKLSSAGLPVFDKLKLLYQDAPSPATMDDFINEHGSLAKNYKQKCIVSFPDQPTQSHPIYIAKSWVRLPDHGPIDPGPDVMAILVPYFAESAISGGTYYTESGYYSSSSTARDFIFRGIVNSSFTPDIWNPAPATFFIRKSGDLTTFRLEWEGSHAVGLYGYCWIPKN